MSAIYKIINIKTMQFYIGGTTNPQHRKNQHWYDLRNNKHVNSKLQESWNEHGEHSFCFVILEHIVDDSLLNEKEDTYLKQEINNELCLNLSFSWTGQADLSEDAKSRISQTLIEYFKTHRSPMFGKTHTQESLEKMRLNKVVHSGEDHYRFGKTLSEEVRKKIGDTQRGKPKAPRTITEEGREKIRRAVELGHYSHWQGKHHTEESKDKEGRKIKEVTQNIGFTTIKNACDYYEIFMPTLINVLKTGLPIAKGEKQGLQFVYVDSLDGIENVNPNLRGEVYQSPIIKITCCTVDGCENPLTGNGLCSKHYQQARKAAKKLKLANS